MVLGGWWLLTPCLCPLHAMRFSCPSDNKADTAEDAAFDVLARELVRAVGRGSGVGAAHSARRAACPPTECSCAAGSGFLCTRRPAARQVFEAKAQPGDRTLSAEELAEQERRRLEAAEAARLQRQRGGPSDDEEGEGGEGGEGGAPAPAGGFAARRAKRQREEAGLDSDDERPARLGGVSGDALEDDFEAGSGSSKEDGGDGEEGGSDDGRGGLSALDTRRQARAAGHHPLQESFKAASAALLAKYGQKAGNLPLAEDEEVAEGSEGEEDGPGSSGSKEEGESGSEEEKKPGSSGEEEEESSSGQEDSEEPPAQTKQQAAEPKQPQQQQPRAAAGANLAGGFALDLPYTPSLPASYEELAAAAAGLGPRDLGELVRRMRVCHLAQLSTDNRKSAQLLYGLLVQHFASLAGGTPPPLGHLDALLPHLLQMTAQVPFYAATLARARLVRAQARLAAALKDPLARADAWPAPRTLLLLKLLAALFPPSDRRHPVLTPAGLLACAALANCPVTRPCHVANGLFLASLALSLHSQAQRFVPEPLAFALRLLRSALPPAAAAALAAEAGDGGEAPAGWLRVPAADAGGLPATLDSIVPLDLAAALGQPCGAGNEPEGTPADAYWSTPAFKTSAAAAAIRLVGRCAQVWAELAALPEVLAPAQATLHALVEAATGQEDRASRAKAKQQQHHSSKRAAQTVPETVAITPGLAALAADTLAALNKAAAAAASTRRPLVNASLLRLPEAKAYNPRFEEGYAQGKDYDPDR